MLPLVSYRMPICGVCKRLDDNGFGWTCEAYPDGVPEEIRVSEIDHRKDYKDDHGLQFVPVDEEATEYAKKIFDIDDDHKGETELKKYRWKKVCKPGDHRHPNYKHNVCHPRMQRHGELGRKPDDWLHYRNEKIAEMLLECMKDYWDDADEAGDLERGVVPEYMMPEEDQAYAHGWMEPDNYQYRKKELWDGLCEHYKHEEWKQVEKQMGLAKEWLEMLKAGRGRPKKQCQPGWHRHMDYAKNACHDRKQAHRHGIGGPDHDRINEFGALGEAVATEGEPGDETEQPKWTKSPYSARQPKMDDGLIQIDDVDKFIDDFRAKNKDKPTTITHKKFISFTGDYLYHNSSFRTSFRATYGGGRNDADLNDSERIWAAQLIDRIDSKLAPNPEKPDEINQTTPYDIVDMLDDLAIKSRGKRKMKFIDGFKTDFVKKMNISSEADMQNGFLKDYYDKVHIHNMFLDQKMMARHLTKMEHIGLTFTKNLKSIQYDPNDETDVLMKDIIGSNGDSLDHVTYEFIYSKETMDKAFKAGMLRPHFTSDGKPLGLEVTDKFNEWMSRKVPGFEGLQDDFIKIFVEEIRPKDMHSSRLGVEMDSHTSDSMSGISQSLGLGDKYTPSDTLFRKMHDKYGYAMPEPTFAVDEEKEREIAESIYKLYGDGINLKNFDLVSLKATLSDSEIEYVTQSLVRLEGAYTKPEQIYDPASNKFTMLTSSMSVYRSIGKLRDKLALDTITGEFTVKGTRSDVQSWDEIKPGDKKRIVDDNEYINHIGVESDGSEYGNLLANMVSDFILPNLPQCFTALQTKILCGKEGHLAMRDEVLTSSNTLAHFNPGTDQIAFPYERLNIDKVKAFIENPNKETARGFLDSMHTVYHEIAHGLDHYSNDDKFKGKNPTPDVKMADLIKKIEAEGSKTSTYLDKIPHCNNYPGYYKRGHQDEYPQWPKEYWAIVFESYAANPQVFIDPTAPELKDLYLEVKEALGGWESPMLFGEAKNELYMNIGV